MNLKKTCQYYVIIYQGIVIILAENLPKYQT